MSKPGVEIGKKATVVCAMLLATACATPPQKTPDTLPEYKIIRAPVKMPAGFDMASLELVHEGRRLRIYTKLRGIDDPGDAKLLFPASVKAGISLTDQQANLLFHTGMQQTNRFETYDDSDTVVHEGARQNYKGEKMDILVEGEFLQERQEIVDIAPYKKVRTSMKLIANMRDVNTGRELFPGAVSSEGHWGDVQGEGVMIPPNGLASNPQLLASIGQDFQHAMDKAIAGAVTRIGDLMRPVGFVTYANATSIDMVGGKVHGFQGGDTVVVVHVEYTDIGEGSAKHRIIGHMQPLAVAHCDGVGTEQSHCELTQIDPSVHDAQHPAMVHDFVILSDRSAGGTRKE